MWVWVWVGRWTCLLSRKVSGGSQVTKRWVAAHAQQEETCRLDFRMLYEKVHSAGCWGTAARAICTMWSVAARSQDTH